MHHVVHDRFELRRNLFALRVRQDGEISAGDIEADPAQRDFILVGNDTADGLRVSFVPIRAQHAALPTLRHAPFDLLDRCLIVLAEDFRPSFHRYSKLKDRGAWPQSPKRFGEVSLPTERFFGNCVPRFHIRARLCGRRATHCLDRIKKNCREGQSNRGSEFLFRRCRHLLVN